MDHLGAIAAAYIVSFAVRIVASLPVPILMVLVARHIRKNVPAWIPCVVLVVAGLRLLLSIPYILIHPFARDALHITIPMEQYARFTAISGIVTWWTGLLFTIAIYVMVKRLYRRAEPSPGPYGSPAAGSPSGQA